MADSTLARDRGRHGGADQGTARDKRAVEILYKDNSDASKLVLCSPQAGACGSPTHLAAQDRELDSRPRSEWSWSPAGGRQGRGSRVLTTEGNLHSCAG